MKKIMEPRLAKKVAVLLSLNRKEVPYIKAPGEAFRTPTIHKNYEMKGILSDLKTEKLPETIEANVPRFHRIKKYLNF